MEPVIVPTIQITLLSAMTGMLLASIFTILLYVFRKKPFFIQQFSFSSISFIYLLCIVRMVLPVEFAFTQTIHVKGLFNFVMDITRVKILAVGRYTLSVTGLLAIIWVSVALVLLGRFFSQYWAVRKIFDGLKKQSNEALQIELFEIEAQKEYYIPIEILCCDGVTSPCSLGLMNRQILLPQRDYSQTELHYILLHEYTHFANHDLAVKMVAHIVKCIFWWNPVVHLLEKDIDQVLELKCDACIIADLSKAEVTDYLQTILRQIVEEAEGNGAKVLPKTTAAFLGHPKLSNIEERFRQIQSATKGQRRPALVQVALVSVSILLIALSYCTIFQPDYDAPYNEIVTDANAREILPEDVYIIQHTDGSYSFVAEGEPRTFSKEMAEIFIQGGTKVIKE